MIKYNPGSILSSFVTCYLLKQPLPRVYSETYNKVQPGKAETGKVGQVRNALVKAENGRKQFKGSKTKHHYWSA